MTSTFAALASAAIVAVFVLPFVVWRSAARRRVWLVLAVIALVLGVGSFFVGSNARRACTAQYGSKTVIVGTELTELGEKYRRQNPDLSRDDILFDSRGDPNWTWTRRSIDRCKTFIAGTYFLWIPFLVVCLLATVQAMPDGVLPVAFGRTPVSNVPIDAPIRYDVFLSYRHGGIDADIARQLLETLESDGYTVAIDERDFAGNASFLEEMERCVRQSRFTVAVVSPRYLESGNCQEEAIVCKVLDMEERKRRLIPVVIQAASMPAWLYGIVGIDCTKADALVDPIEKLEATLGPPLQKAVAPSPATSR